MLITNAKSNMASACQNPDVIDNYVHREISLHRFLGPMDLSLFGRSNPD